ncbi:MAG: DUF1906 domain-containing protein [Lachnospiraceae bacterium]|nr:DUF1906 domain-containing protein [Lachnospiraceae bacterium]
MISGVDAYSSLANIASTLYSQGYRFAARYYCSNGSAKLMSTSESATLASAGHKRVVVFQNTNNSYSYFSSAQGQADASYAVSLATARGQTSGSAIYFAVDFDATEAQINANIMLYFSAVSSVITAAGYYVGVYGSGMTCRKIRNAGYASYSWLAMPTGWAEYSTYTSWNIKQTCSTTISGVSVDIDSANSVNSIGGW